MSQQVPAPPAARLVSSPGPPDAFADFVGRLVVHEKTGSRVESRLLTLGTTGALLTVVTAVLMADHSRFDVSRSRFFLFAGDWLTGYVRGLSVASVPVFVVAAASLLANLWMASGPTRAWARWYCLAQAGGAAIFITLCLMVPLVALLNLLLWVVATAIALAIGALIVIPLGALWLASGT
jgi:hypothetical protein